MTSNHITTDQLDRLLRDEMEGDEARSLVWHLLDQCQQCAAVAEVAWPVEVEDPSSLSAAIEDSVLSLEEDSASGRLQELVRGRVSALRSEREEAGRLLETLDSEPFERQIILLRSSQRFRTLAVVEHLLERARAEGFEEPQRADAVAQLALEVIDSFEPERYGREVLNDIRGRAWAYRGNFHRIASDHRAAERAFAEAERFLTLGTGDLMERAKLLDLLASLRFRQDRFDEAIELTRRVITLYLGLNEEHHAGRAMLTQANIFQYLDEPKKSLRAIREALDLIDPEREPRLVYIGHQSLLVCLNFLGRYAEAQELIPKTRRLVIELGTRFDLLRLRAAEGKVLEGLGHTDRAEAAFLEVQKGYVEAGLAFDAAQVSVDLAMLYARQGRTAEMKQLAQEIIPIFESRDVHQETLAALLIFRRALEMEQGTLSRVQEIADYLRRARINPSLRFQPTQPD